MTDEPKKDHPEDIESILSDLDEILAGPSGTPAAPKPADLPQEPPKIAVPVPQLEPAKAEAPKPVESPKAAPAPPPTPAKTPPSIELAPREGMIKAPEKKPEPAKPPPAPVVPPPAPVIASPASASAPVPTPAIESAKIAVLPVDTPKEQIRRVAYVYTSSCAEAKTAFAAFLTQAAQTISKKPLFLREVLSHEVADASDPNAVLQKSLQAKAAAILAVVEGWPTAKVDELSEACSRASVLFRLVTPADAQKKSTAVDIIVDMMLLPGEG